LLVAQVSLLAPLASAWRRSSGGCLIPRWSVPRQHPAPD
jgi:hypothetical protein